MPGRLIPRLHVITDDDVLARPDFLPLAKRILGSNLDRVALHVRGHESATRHLFELTQELAQRGCCFVNDRVDIALAAGARGVQLGARSLPVPAARAVIKQRMLIGQSVHTAAECDRQADFAIFGMIYPSRSHPGQTPAGLELIAECAAVLPVIGIGGITRESVAEVIEAGAHGVAVIRAVWDAPDPVQEAGEFARMLYGC